MFFSIKLRVFIIITAFFTIVITANMFFDLKRSDKQLTQYLENLNKSTARVLSANIKGDLYNLNYTNVKNTINSFDNEYFKNIYVLNEYGYIFTQRNHDEIAFKAYENFDELSKKHERNPFIFFEEIKISNKIIGYLVIENNSKIFEAIHSEKKRDIFQVFLILLIVTVGLSYIVSIIITEPILKMINSIKKLDENQSLHLEHSKDEFGFLSRVIEDNHNRIKELNDNLESKVKQEVKKNRQKDKMLQDQDLKASIGGMMDAIAHQWKQPLSVISIIVQELEFNAEYSKVEQKDIKRASDETQIQVDHMIDTLDEFRSFFRGNKKTQSVKFKDLVESTLRLLKDDIHINQIHVSIDCNQEEKVNIIPNEFKHVLINIINNAKDAFIENKIKNRKIDIVIYEKDNNVIVNIQDNAGGIPIDIVDKIFEPNITTKEEGTGIGLYMSKVIIEKIGGSIEVCNKNEGACFTMSLKI